MIIIVITIAMFLAFAIAIALTPRKPRESDDETHMLANSEMQRSVTKVNGKDIFEGTK